MYRPAQAGDSWSLGYGSFHSSTSISRFPCIRKNSAANGLERRTRFIAGNLAAEILRVRGKQLHEPDL